MATFPQVEEEREAFRVALGRTLGRVRKKLTEYSQVTIAEALDVDPDTVGRWERGERDIRVYDLARIWERYQVPADWFLDPTDSVKELDARIRHERQTRAAQEAGRADAGHGPDQPSGDGKRPRRGRPQA